MAGKKTKGKKKPGAGNSKAQQQQQQQRTGSSSRSPPLDDQDACASNSSKRDVETGDVEASDRSSSNGIAPGTAASIGTGLASLPGAEYMPLLSQPTSSYGYPRSGAGSGRRAVWAEDAGGRDTSGANGDARSSFGPGSSLRDGDWRRRVGGERERDRDMGERDRDKDKGGGGLPGDECHNGEGLGRSPLIRQSAEKQWSWLGYSAKQFRSFAQEFPPTLDVGADEVRIKVEDIKCGTCRDRLHEALSTGMSRGGFPLTKLVKLAACHGDSVHSKRDGRGSVAETSPSMSGKDEPMAPGGRVDRLRIRAPVTPDLLRQVIGVVQASAAAPGGTAAAVAITSGADDKSTEVLLGELTAEEWLSTYPAPTAALLSGEAPNGLRGTGSGTLAVPIAYGSSSEDKRDLWTLMERAQRAKDNAFKCCLVIEASTGVGLHDPTGSGAGSAGGAGSGTGLASMTSNIEWNPQFAPRLQEAETALVDWLTELTMALHGLAFPFTLAFITDEDSPDSKNDLAETGALAEDLWTAYEESVKRQLEITLEARREQLREQSQPMGIALCFAAQNRACAAELLERKRAEMTALHEATVGVLQAPERQPLLRRAEAAREKWSGLLMGEDFHTLDDLVERVLRARLQVFKCESFAYNASSDVIQAEQAADSQLKAVVQDWEEMMETFKIDVEKRVAGKLNPMVYPQAPALTEAMSTWLSTFKNDWVGNETTQQLHAHIRQRQVHGLCQSLVLKKQRLKTSKDEAEALTKQRRKKDTRSGAIIGGFSPSEQSEDLSKQRKLEEKCSELATAISLTQQEQIETCLTYRLFAVGQLHQRYRRLRLFFAQLRCRVAARASQATHLCGAEGDADERIKIMGACLMLEIVEEACLRWTAVQNERQLVEGMNREDASLDAKRRKRERAKAKVRETKTAAAAAAAKEAALIEATAAAAAAAKTALKTEIGNTDPVAPDDAKTAENTESGGDTPGQRPDIGAPNGNPEKDDSTQHSKPVEASNNGSGGGLGVGARPSKNRRSGSPGQGGFGPNTQASSHGGRWGGRAGRNSEECSGVGWRGAERAVPGADEDGFVTIAKSKPRRSARDSRETFVHNGKGAWGRGVGDGGGRGRGGGGSWYGESGGRPNGYGPDGGRDRGRDLRGHEQEDRRGKYAAAGAAAPTATHAGNPSAASVGEAAGGAWVQRSKPVVEQQPEVCGSTESAAGASIPVANGWPVPSSQHLKTAVNGIRSEAAAAVAPAERSGGWSSNVGSSWSSADPSSQPSTASPAAAAKPTASSNVPSADTIASSSSPAREVGEAAGGGSSMHPVHTTLSPEAGAWGAGGSPVAPEEEIPEAVPMRIARVEEASTGGRVKSSGEFSGGAKVIGPGQSVETGAGGAAATASAVLGPESEVARVTTGRMREAGTEERGGLQSAVTHGVEVTERQEGDEEVEEFVFQFGTVNLSDDDSSGNVDVRGSEQALTSMDSPENSRYENGEDEAEEKELMVMEDSMAGHEGMNSDVSGLTMQDDGQQPMSQGEMDNVARVDHGDDGVSQTVSRPLQTEQLRDGVFFPAHPPPPPQGNTGYMAAPYQPQHLASMQQQSQQQQHQHQMQHQQSQHSSMNQQHVQQQQQRGFTPASAGGAGSMHGMQSQHHSHQHHQPHSNPYSMNNQRGIGMGGHHPPHSPNDNSGSFGAGLHGRHGHYQSHRRVPSHPKSSSGPRNASGNGGPHSPNRAGGYSDVGPYGTVLQQTADGYWGGGMMHYQIPGTIMGPAPGGIGVTDGQAVYYPPPPHMMVQGDGSGHGHGGAPWHPRGHMGMGMGSGMDAMMDMNGMPGMPPWVPDAQHYMHPSAQGWGSPTHHNMSGYAPPPPQQQQAPPPPVVHAQSLGMSVQGQQNHNVHHQQQQPQRQKVAGQQQHGTQLVTPTLASTPASHQMFTLQPIDEGMSSDDAPLGGMGADGTETTAVQDEVSAGPMSDTTAVEMMAPESDTALASQQAVAAEASPVITPVSVGTAGCGGIEGDGVPQKRLCGEETGAAELVPVGPTGRYDVEGTRGESERNATTAGQTVTLVDGWVDGDNNNNVDMRQDAGGQAAVSAAATADVTALAAGSTSARQKKGKKEKGKKGVTGAQGQGPAGLRQATSSNSNGVIDSPQSDSRGKGEGSKGGSRDSAPGSEGDSAARRARGRDTSPSVSPAVSTKKDLPSPSAPMPRGLVNAMGQNNCFLNVVVQSLWHLEAFRARFSGSGSGMGAWGKKPQAWGSGRAATTLAVEEASHRVEASLRGLFQELSAGVESEGSSTVGGTAQAEANGDRSRSGNNDTGGDDGNSNGNNGASSASVEALRAALAEISGARFGVGKMDDAAEAMETILGCLVQGSSAAVIRQVFSMRFREALTCPKCGTSSPEKPVEYEANVYYAHVSALREAREKDSKCPFDVALRAASHGDLVTCRNAACTLSRRREPLPSQRYITGEPPSVFSLGLVWNHWGPGLVADLLRMLNPVVDLDVVFPRGPERGVGGGIAGKAQLRGFFCFQVQKHHYVAFVYNIGRQEWLLLDDDQAVPIGPDFSGVLARCKKDKLHPSLFFYERQHPLA